MLKRNALDHFKFSYGFAFIDFVLFLQIWRYPGLLQRNYRKPLEKCSCFFNNIYCLWKCFKIA